MNDWEMLRRTAERLRKNYPSGTRVRLIQMGSDPHPDPPGTEGTITFIDDCATVHVNWDNGRTLGLVWGEDTFEKVPEQAQANDDPAEDDSMGGMTL